MMLINLMVIVLICLGLLLFAIGVIGVLRFPDFFSRMHAAGKCDSLAVVLVVAGFAIYSLEGLNFASILVALKIFLIAIFIFVASPTATHALVKTALLLGAKPWERQELKTRRVQR